MPKTNLRLMIVENIGICVQNNISISLYFHGKYKIGYLFLKFGKWSSHRCRLLPITHGSDFHARKILPAAMKHVLALNYVQSTAKGSRKH